jgi:hypothetical protein
VVKTTDISLFCESTIQYKQVDPALFEAWQNENATLDVWTERFSIAGLTQEVLSKDVLKESAAMKEVARNFKTPIKPAHQSVEDDMTEMIELVYTNNLYKFKILATGEAIGANDQVLLTEVIKRHGRKT